MNEFRAAFTESIGRIERAVRQGYDATCRANRAAGGASQDIEHAVHSGHEATCGASQNAIMQVNKLGLRMTSFAQQQERLIGQQSEILRQYNKIAAVLSEI